MGRSPTHRRDQRHRSIVITDFEDDLGEARTADLPLMALGVDELERILVEQGHCTPEALATVSGERGLGIFVRSLVGLDRSAAEAAFAKKITLTPVTRSVLATTHRSGSAILRRNTFRRPL